MANFDILSILTFCYMNFVCDYTSGNFWGIYHVLCGYRKSRTGRDYPGREIISSHAGLGREGDFLYHTKRDRAKKITTFSYCGNIKKGVPLPS
jgi:hypothetical protein